MYKWPNRCSQLRYRASAIPTTGTLAPVQDYSAGCAQYFDPFDKFLIKKQLIFNIFPPNLQIMYTGTCATNLYEKITASLHHDLDMASELLAGLSHSVPREVCHHLCDVDHQRGSGVVGAL